MYIMAREMTPTAIVIGDQTVIYKYKEAITKMDDF